MFQRQHMIAKNREDRFGFFFRLAHGFNELVQLVAGGVELGFGFLSQFGIVVVFELELPFIEQLFCGDGDLADFSVDGQDGFSLCWKAAFKALYLVSSSPLSKAVISLNFSSVGLNVSAVLC
jgi:hypothetical protein